MSTAVAGGAARSARSARRRLLAALRPALGPWVAVHLVALAALALVSLSTPGELPWAGAAHDARGWWSWDAGWYREIAAGGYSGPAEGDVRFFPLFPLLGRLVGLLPLLSAGAGLVVVASAAALGYLAALARLTERVTGSADTARRTAWVAALFPGAAVLALPYTEALAGLLAVLFFLGVQSRSVPLVVVAGVLSGATRPTGLLLVVAAGLLLLTDRSRRRVALPGCVAPLVGTLSFSLWSHLAYGDAMAPYDLQSRSDLRGGVLVNPVPGVLSDSGGGLPPLLTLLLAVAAVVLLAVAARTLPLPYAGWSAVVLLLAMSSTEAHSLPRYVAGIFPLMIAGGVVLPAGRAARALLAVLALASVALTATWFADLVVP
jgi:hypothetical protein